MIITSDSHPDERRRSISSPNHYLIKAVISCVQPKFASNTSGCE